MILLKKYGNERGEMEGRNEKLEGLGHPPRIVNYIEISLLFVGRVTSPLSF